MLMLTLRGIFVTCLIVLAFNHSIEWLYEPQNFLQTRGNNEKMEDRREAIEKTFSRMQQKVKQKKQSTSSILISHGSSNIASSSLCQEINITLWSVGHLVCTQPYSNLKQLTIKAIELQSLHIFNEIEKISKDMPRGTQSLLVATESSFQSFIRIMSSGLEEPLNSVQTIVFIDANRNFIKSTNIQQLIYLQKNRRQAMRFKTRLQFVLIFTNPSLKQQLMPSLLIQNLNCSFISITSLQLWNIYKTFETSRQLLLDPAFQHLMSQLAQDISQSPITLKQIQYWLTFGEPTNKLETHRNIMQLNKQMQIRCRDQRYITFTREGEIYRTWERCVAVKVDPSIPNFRELILFIRSSKPISIVTLSQQYVSPFLRRQNLNIHIWQRLTHMNKIMIYNPQLTEIDMTVCPSVNLDAQKLRGSVAVLQNSGIVRLPDIPLTICPSDTLLLPQVGKGQCFQGQSKLILKNSNVNLRIFQNSRQILRRLSEKHVSLHGRVLFLTTIMFRVLSLPLLLVTLIILMIVAGIVQPQVHPAYILLYTVLMVGVASILNSIINSNQLDTKDQEEGKKDDNEPSIINNFLFLAPNILCICNWVGLDLPVQLQWICLLLAHLPVKNKMLTPLNLYLFYLNLPNVTSGQLTYHFYLLLVWLYLQPYIDQLCTYELDLVRNIALRYCVLLMVIITQETGIVLFLVQVMALEISLRAAWLAIKKELMLTDIHRRLKKLL